MKKIFSAIILFSIISSTALAAPAGLRQVKSYSDGRLYKAGDFNVVVLKGDWRQMGMQYGRLMREQLVGFYETAVTKNLAGNNISLERIGYIASAVYEKYPDNFKAFMQGAAETSGMEINKLLILDQIIPLSVLTRGGCSFIAASGDYTSNSLMVVGRNADYPVYFKEYDKFLTLTVFNPKGSIVSAATFGYAGSLSTYTGINSAGLFLAMNSTISPYGRLVYKNRTPIALKSLEYLLNSASILQMEDEIKTTEASAPSIVNIACDYAAYSYEMLDASVIKADAGRKGLLVSTNHFVGDAWGIIEPDAAHNTVMRYNNLLNLGRKYRGDFNEKSMRELLDTTIDLGGATFINDTSYQVTAVPQTMLLWVKAPVYSDWTSIEVSRLFSR